MRLMKLLIVISMLALGACATSDGCDKAKDGTEKVDAGMCAGSAALDVLNLIKLIKP